MIKYNNTLRVSLAKELYEFAQNIISGQYQEPVKTWTNYAWSDSIIGKNSSVFCISIPDRYLKEIEDTLISRGILNTETDKLITETRSAMIYVWMPGSYIPYHSDAKYSKAVTVYLNEEWGFNDGGFFTWREPNDEDWVCVIPHFNLGIVNAFGLEHGTTPVTSDKLRVTVQIFLKKKDQDN
jgi:hypothetical protein